ncbi:GGDEF domain-containing protein [Reinekea blandensis]|uniref:diguanylate cyclase n=1 Tax=Reinekea blandensis MED297 TaxID=314283 RepID=A4BJH5_9GAMM|nr:GGDEF domain-containing protein [Reinekea blandensis]EAR07747.1 Putative diguanylate cyclase (GGDEF domain) [Reinekea sp. MED297] [Reinekea blandensis MED297]
MPSSFTQSSIGRSSENSVFSSVSSFAFEAPSADRIQALRLQLATALQTSLDIDQILTLLHRHLKAYLPISGIHYVNGDAMIDTYIGRSAKHRCQYQLNMQKQAFGDISFVRSKRFSEQEMAFIESIMDLVIFPLRNALKYREAMATAMIDPLTGLNNRGAMAITLEREMERARRNEDQDLSIILIDVDHFKSINDRYGHLAGDDILRQVARVIHTSVRRCDVCFRYGGEEFLICLTNSTLELARSVAERVRLAIPDQVKLADRERPVTASFGVAHYEGEADWPALVNRADQALFSAKDQGRNCVVTSLVTEQDALSL